jgi:hypothetical protein
LLQAHAPTAIIAARVFADQFDARAIERVDHLHQRTDDAAHRPLTRLHPLDGRQGHSGQRGKRLLVNAQERARCSHLK